MVPLLNKYSGCVHREPVGLKQSRAFAIVAEKRSHLGKSITFSFHGNLSYPSVRDGK